MTLAEKVPKLLDMRKQECLAADNQFDSDEDEPSKLLRTLTVAGSRVRMVHALDPILKTDSSRQRRDKTMKAVCQAKGILPGAKAMIIFVSTVEDVDALRLRLSRVHAEQHDFRGTDEEVLGWGEKNMAWFCTTGEKHKDV